MTYEETMDWIKKSRAEHDAAMEAHEKKVAEITANRQDSTMRLDVVQNKLSKFREELDDIAAKLAGLA